MLEKDLEIKDTDKQWRKLVDYFNQWREEKFWEKWHFTYTMRFDEVHLISKKMWFIQWLVDNDKIDKQKVKEKSEFLHIYTIPNPEKYYKSLIMELSIQDNPIEFLISILR